MAKKPVYKVVKSKTLGSTSLTSRSPFYRRYGKSFEVKSEEGSLGIFCFKRRWQAENYINEWQYRIRQYKIIRVFPLGKATIPERISSDTCVKFLKRFNRGEAPSICTSVPPEGTICYPSVIVLE